ncbi:uncharacterized protein LOC125683290 isoform X2 [Ostrea edulis]|uniref:uncharacterized protein LOC125683290 isoform X2 n=1 Tax=Ostrea edulis TaxID=37623 RepID=UPI0024AF01BA|nr:uncharacterized protein LOC125683290 isoform X2 [Ostrea edulis]
MSLSEQICDKMLLIPEYLYIPIVVLSLYVLKSKVHSPVTLGVNIVVIRMPRCVFVPLYSQCGRITILGALFIILYHANNTDARFMVHDTPLSYEQAVKTCEVDYYGRLAGKHDINDNIISNLSENTQYWLNEYTVLSDWINYVGCFNATIVSEVDVLDIAIKPHTVASCYDECNQANLFALQGGRCWCLNGTVVKTDRLNTSLCSSRCSGTDKYENCGADDFFSVYSKYAKANVTKVHHRRCSYYICNATFPKGLLAADFCNTTHSVVCASENENASKVELGTYYDAVRKCQINGTLVYNNAKDGRGVCAVRDNVYQKKGFWTSIYRYEQILQPDDGIKGMENSYRCQILFVRNKVPQISLVPCDLFAKRPFFCMPNTEPTVTVPTMYEMNIKHEESSTSGLVAGIVVTSLISVFSLLVVLFVARKRFKKKLKRKRTTKFTYINNTVSIEDGENNDEIERCERQIGNRGDNPDHQRYTDTLNVGQTNNETTGSEMTVEYDFVNNSHIEAIASEENIYDNNSQTGDDTYYEMSPDNDVRETSASNNIATQRFSDNPLPDYLEGIYDTPVASIVHESSLRKSATKSEEANDQSDNQNLNTNENLNEISYEQMESLENGEDNYREMSGI